MKSKKKPLVAAAISALLALAGSVSAQGTGGSTDRHAGTGRKVHRSLERGKKGAKVRRHRLASGKKATKHRRHGQKSKKRRPDTPPPQ
jgi:hypothetical protein